MKRSAVLGLALLGVLRGSPAGAQTGKTYRVGFLTGATLAVDQPYLDAFRRTLSGLGYQEGKNLEIEYRSDGGDDKRLVELAADLVRAKPNVILATGGAPVAAIKRTRTSIPVVMILAADPVGSGFVVSLARPGGNITGTTNMGSELLGKQIQLLVELVPRLRRVAIVLNPATSASPWREAEKAARTSGIQAVAVYIRSPDQIDPAFKTIPRLRVDAILVPSDGLMVSNAARIVHLVAARRLPAVYSQQQFTAVGGLLEFGTSYPALWRQAATYVARILKGANPADLPVERPTTFELIVNLKTARSLGITVPQSILLQATQVIR